MRRIACKNERNNGFNEPDMSVPAILRAELITTANVTLVVLTHARNANNLSHHSLIFVKHVVTLFPKGEDDIL